MTLINRIAAAQTAALTTAAERAILTGEGTAASAGLSLQSIAAAHAEAEQVHRYLDAAEAEARTSHNRIQESFNRSPSEAMLQSLAYVEGVLHAVATARRLLRSPDLLAVVTSKRATASDSDPWWPVFRRALHLIEAGCAPDAMDRIGR